MIADDVSADRALGIHRRLHLQPRALTAVKTDVYGPVGLFVTFSFTILIFAMVIMVFLRWVDRIARLGRLGSTIDRVEAAARQAIEQRRQTPLLGGRPVADAAFDGPCVYAKAIGYVQSIDVGALQRWAEKADVRLRVESLPGTFIGPGRAVARLPAGATAGADDAEAIAGAFIIGEDRTFEEDPRFGIVTLAEIAARALSPAVNDPGTAIDTIGTFVRLRPAWIQPLPDPPAPRFDRVFVPPLNLHDMFDDAFTAIARDGASSVEVGVRLQKALQSFASIGNPAMTEAARRHSALAVARAEGAMTLPEDVEQVRRAAAAVQQAAAGIR